MMKDAVKKEMILVEWQDSTSYDDWDTVDSIATVTPHTIRTAGFLIAENDACLAISANVDQVSGDCSCTMIIPKVLISRRFKVYIQVRDNDDNVSSIR